MDGRVSGWLTGGSARVWAPAQSPKTEGRTSSYVIAITGSVAIHNAGFKNSGARRDARASNPP